MNNLKSPSWPGAVEQMRKCHLSSIAQETADLKEWKNAFDLLVQVINEEREAEPLFSEEFEMLTEATGCDYDFCEILEEYFDFLEEKEAWEEVIASAETMMDLFAWTRVKPSEYMFRKGNALQKMNRLDEARAFGSQWLKEYPKDLYAAASNVFLLISMNQIDEAKAITEEYLGEDLICDKTTDTFFMAAYRLYELTDNIHAKQRVEKKMAEYNALLQNK